MGIIAPPMFKFALAAGIVAEWLLGPPVESLLGLGLASLRALTGVLLAWMVLEAIRVLIMAVMTLEDKA